MTTWIINASPLILLGKIDRLSLLTTLASSFQIPFAVSQEILDGPDGDPARSWIQSPPITARIEPDTLISSEIMAWDLGKGETAVLAMASKTTNALCVLDDLAARHCAEVFQIPVIGTLGILVKAKLAGLVPKLEPEIQRLLEVGSLLSPVVIQKALSLAGEV